MIAEVRDGRDEVLDGHDRHDRIQGWRAQAIAGAGRQV
jgi:hypothetical protein